MVWWKCVVSADANRVLTESGPGTPGGHILRQYWQPAALTEELAGDRPLVPVTLMNEKLVLFADELGRLGLVGRRCPHRGVDLSFGRLEDGGLRCPFHGWLLDVDGTCLETPTEPETSRLRERIRHRSYPVQERNGIVWAYLGEGVPPPLPGFDCLIAPQSHVFTFKGLWDWGAMRQSNPGRGGGAPTRVRLPHRPPMPASSIGSWTTTPSSTDGSSAAWSPTPG